MYRTTNKALVVSLTFTVRKIYFKLILTNRRYSFGTHTINCQLDFNLFLCCFTLVYHDFFTQFGTTKIYVKKKNEGYGLMCHRAIKTICQVVGIKDLYAKIEGPTNVQNITKAFFLGLLQQVGYNIPAYLSH